MNKFSYENSMKNVLHNMHSHGKGCPWENAFQKYDFQKAERSFKKVKFYEKNSFFFNYLVKKSLQIKITCKNVIISNSDR